MVDNLACALTSLNCLVSAEPFLFLVVALLISAQLIAENHKIYHTNSPLWLKFARNQLQSVGKTEATEGRVTVQSGSLCFDDLASVTNQLSM